MKFFQGYNKITAVDIASCCAVTQSTTKYNMYGQHVMLAATTNPGNNPRYRLIHTDAEISEIKNNSNHYVSAWGVDKEYINLKYVPLKIKNADYNNCAEYLDAVMNFINGRKDRANGKRLIQQNNTKAEGALTFMEVMGMADDTAKNAGYKPTRAPSWYKNKYGVTTVNELYAQWRRERPSQANKYYALEFEKDRKNKFKFEVQTNGRGKVTVSGLDPERSAELIKTLFGFLK